MPEDQNIEWKLTWKDEYLKWICGFANAQGGRIYIGVDDNGNVVRCRRLQTAYGRHPKQSSNVFGDCCRCELIRGL